MNLYGYVRVSSRDQNTARQLDALKPYEIPEKHLYIDRQSGKDFRRPAYEKLIRRLQEGDLLIVKSIDRPGRNYDEILRQWRIITKEIRADILIVDMPLLWPSPSGKISDSGRRKASKPQRNGASGSAEPRWKCRMRSDFTEASGKKERSPPVRRPGNWA